MSVPGNKNALGNEGGRPREYDRIAIGKEFVEWAKNDPDAFIIPMFTAQRGLTTRLLMEWNDNDPEFSEYYKLGKEFIALNRFKSANGFNTKTKIELSTYLRGAGRFEYDLHKYERDEKQFESSLKAQEHRAVSEYEEKKHDSLMQKLDELQLSSERKIDSTKSKDAQRS